MPITWKNIEAPDFRGSSAMMGQAGDALSNALQGLQNIAQDQQAIQQKNYEVGQAKKLGAFDLALRGLDQNQTNELMANPNALANLLGTNDAATVAAAQKSLGGRYDVLADTAAKQAALEAERAFTVQQAEQQNVWDQEKAAQQNVWDTQLAATKAANDAANAQADRAHEVKMFNLEQSTVKPEYTVTEQYNETTGTKERIAVNKNNPNDVVVLGGSEQGKQSKEAEKAEVKRLEGIKTTRQNGTETYNTTSTQLSLLSGITDDDIANVGGWSSIGGAFTPETNASRAKFDQILASGFMTNIGQMKGMGALSNAEGSKVTAAYTALVDPETNTLRTGLDEKFIKSELTKLNELAQQGQKVGQWMEQTGRKPTSKERDLIANGSIKIAPTNALELLRQNPSARDQFKSKYGYLPTF